ncbi:UDP-glucuronosyltransferase 3A1-like [Spea bombifrons]|uniref:UDP-glucuronosyltransferase 3A1-like n=1 Tax=Spea bombifrons TaxID=233779 RepID=UPI002349D605|nr:UDP-glucuronosyltransferase 3A1-like [Spea bombifrons]
MATGRLHFLLVFLTQQLLLTHGAKILTICLVGGSHYLLMDEISRVLHTNGHDVRMFLQVGEGMMPGYKLKASPYPVITWPMDENYLKEFNGFIKEHQREFFMGRSGLHSYFEFLKQISHQCKHTLNQKAILKSLKDDKYDIAIIDAFNPCTFLISEKLGLRYIAFFPGTFANAIEVGLPTPLSYVPIYQSQLSDRMDFFQRVKNTFMYFASRMVDLKVQAIFEEVITEHFAVESRPAISDLYLKPELWFYNTDFTFDFARPLLPHIQCIGGLMAKPAKPVSQELEDFISQSGESGFIVVSLGSMVASCPQKELLKEMNGAFAKVPQKVIWRYHRSQWPTDVELPPNVKLMDWISQNDLLGHPKARLLVTHGGMNSLMEAIYHGVPVVGIPLFGDQFDNLVRIKAKHIGTSIPPDQITADHFANIIRQITEDVSYKSEAMKLSAIRKSRPFPPDQQLVRWVEHIIRSGGGRHLHPYAFQQPWYQQYLLDVILFITICLILVIYLIVKILTFLAKKLCSRQKQKQT